MMILNLIATICFVIGFELVEESEPWGTILWAISSTCFTWSMIQYEGLKERIKTLERKGGGSDA